MKKQEVVRLYNFADAKLVTMGLEKAAYMNRDSAEFDSFGITTTSIAALVADLNAFAERLTDVEALGNQTQITQTKDAKGEELRVAIRNIMARVVLVYKTTSPQYKKYGTDTLSEQTDSDLIITAKRVVRVGTEHLADITPHGVTAVMLSNLDTTAEEFSNLIVDMKIEIAIRDIEQENRVEAGNMIYNKLVRYTTTGQNIWETSDVAKFNDYVLYNTISGEEEVPAPTP